ncbi:MAG TPA: 1-deoxy-D-xylulose-5-phosphate reductoisomerase [Spongiibacteraceae bacterium]|nr:1-deoxy-D-xylulose-5-phosphate reductoisomerase [Spongiibacteraceae bacterium]
MTKKAVTVLGATGSIGASTLDVIARHPERYSVFALSAHASVNKLAELAQRFHPRYVVIGDEPGAEQLRALLSGSGVEVLCGNTGCQYVSAHADVDIVVAAIVGAAGLQPTLAAVEAGKHVLLVNKESLVMAGRLFIDAVAASGATLLPVDSEHNAIFQCMPPAYVCGRETPERVGVRKILLTGSGGPFRNTPLSGLVSVTPAQAIAHPNWSMGPKISVDSATMMNKGLELIEACWLFDARPEQVQIVVHPQSVIHSMVEYIDGSVLAQLGNPDMRTPIAHALAWPERIESGVGTLDLIAQARLDFQAPDYERFPCLRLAAEAMRAGGTAPAVLNAANEVAVAAFLAEEIPFTAIPTLIERVLARVAAVEPHTLADVQSADREAREVATAYIAELSR